MESRIEDLEVRFAYQEQAIDELTRQVRLQERNIEELRLQLRHLYDQMKQMSPSNIAPMSEETPPPHY